MHCATAGQENRHETPSWMASGELPKGIDAALLKAFWAQGPAEDSDDRFREACIALEVFGEIESPAEDKKARMNYQLRRLTQGLGHRVQEPSQALIDHINAFHALRPASSWVERFYAGVKSIRR